MAASLGVSLHFTIKVRNPDKFLTDWRCLHSVGAPSFSQHHLVVLGVFVLKFRRKCWKNVK